MNEVSDTIWDVVVIGGGASGMMAAGKASSSGKKVLIVEKNNNLGKKLLITGGGRCNLTNNEKDIRKFLSKYKDSDKFLFSAFSQFSVTDTLEFFEKHGVSTKIEANGRVFPVSNKSQSVWDALFNVLSNNSVSILSNSEVIRLNADKDKVASVVLKNNKIIRSKSFILATGGKSHPETGSTGDGFNWLKEIGHKVIEQEASLVPIISEENWVKRLQGVALDDVRVSLYQNKVKQFSMSGRVLFTHFGLSGPTILNLSSEVRELLKYGEVIINIDLLPHLDHGELNSNIQELFKNNNNKKIKNALSDLVPSTISPIIIQLSQIDGETQCNSITRESRINLIDTIKNLQIEVSGLLGEDKAIVTSGGVELTEVDFKTMRSKLYSNLFLIGDILNIDRPSGGYSLQLCWTTGYIAGVNA